MGLSVSIIVRYSSNLIRFDEDTSEHDLPVAAPQLPPFFAADRTGAAVVPCWDMPIAWE
jgi:hypothetical protein